MSADKPTPSPVAPPISSAPPRMRIHHVMVWMVVVAISSTLYRLFIVRETPVWYSSSFQGQGYGWAVAMSAVGLVIQAAGITLFIFAFIWHVKRIAVFREPGQWLLCAFPYSILEPAFNHLVFPALFTTLFNEQPWHQDRLIWELGDIARAIFWISTFVLQIGLPAMFFGWCAWKNASTRAWRLLFASFSVGLFAWSLAVFLAVESMNRTAPGFAIAVYYYVPSYAAAILTTTAMTNDFITARKRSWIHWSGATLFALSQWWIVFSSLVWWSIL